MGKLRYTFFKFPKDFKPYLLSVNKTEYLNEQQERLNEKQHEKQLNKKMMKLH
ncbi:MULTISPECIES: hypothetical protein [Limosilactobacillus]|uniref:Uncharacterized protein n=1 Tax=Limosilactobacillus coleohominis TaxID=181675 RepID=A0ABS2GYH9_9LACO|nr:MULTISPECIES: hypothetical protein [Limosilactobacillus]MBM6941340.1 hypothetical protein [Limosilactobacillus coleohominis]MCI6852438.1 hypothetical protein [Limosilactobacillus vaginalis]